MARLRERKKEQRRSNQRTRTYEAAGDIAMERFAYIEATAQFERALAESRTGEDEVRLCDKIGESVFFGARPDLATPWFERALERCTAVSSTDGKTLSLRGKITYVMRKLPLQCWIESRTKDALDCSLQVRASAIADGDVAAIQTANVSVAYWLVCLGRYSEAESYLVTARESDIAETPLARTSGPSQRAIIWAAQGNAPAAFIEFDRAVEASKELPDGYITTIIWDDYANWATALGRLDIARACRERALLVARERRITWRVPYLTLRFAGTLVTEGEYDHARDLVRDALTYDTNTPVIHVLVSTVGVEIARVLGDEVFLKRTMDNRALDLALQSGEPERIAPIVAAYAKVHVARGQLTRAKTVIALGMDAVTQGNHTGDLLALAARYGSPAQATRARKMLVERIGFPHHRVAQAYLGLWEAYDALRRRATAESRECAQNAAKLFGRLGWKHQQAEALALAGIPRQAHKRGETHVDIGSRVPVLSDLNPGLTSREQQVASLVLRGLTNRAIAQTLSISEHTVETHMTSILNRLGLRSRWQLIDLSRA